MTAITEQEQYAFCNKALSLKEMIESSFVHLGQLLYEIKENRHYEAGFDSWGTFLMEMRMSQAVASKLMTIYKTLVLEYKVEPAKIAQAGGYSVVYELMPLMTDKKSANEWIKKAASMTRLAIKQEKAEAMGEQEPKVCEHDFCTMCRECHFISE